MISQSVPFHSFSRFGLMDLSIHRASSCGSSGAISDTAICCLPYFSSSSCHSFSVSLPVVWFRTLTLNAGTNKGVDVDMAVICSDGLVGRVTEVGYDWCKVTSIIDSSSTVPILVERTRDNCMARGILDGSSDEAVMELYYLPTDRTNLTPGDTVVTSGMGGIYPKGLIVGTVKEVMIGGEVSAIITPSVDFMHLEEVAVILGEGAEQ